MQLLTAIQKMYVESTFDFIFGFSFSGFLIHFSFLLQVIHGDVNLQNILVRHSDRTVKLIDFGSSHILKLNEREEERPLRPERGNILYYPPADERLSFEWDSWSCGVVLYAMVMGFFPFDEEVLLSKKGLKLVLPPEKSDGMKERFIIFDFFAQEILLYFSNFFLLSQTLLFSSLVFFNFMHREEAS